MSETSGYIPPDAEQFKQESKEPQEVKLGESVRPFENFDEKFEIRKNADGEIADVMSGEYHTEGIGNWRVDADYFSLDHKFESDVLGLESALIALPTREREIKGEELHAYVQKMETRLLDLAIFVGKDGDPNIPTTKFSIRLPSGNEITTNFKGVGVSFTDHLGRVYDSLLVPAVSNAFERIEITPESFS